MEKLTACPLCKDTGPFRTSLQCRDYLVSGAVFGIQQCGACAFLFTNPRPNNLNIKEYYRSEDYISHTGRRKTLNERLYHLVKRRMLKKKLGIISDHAGVHPAGVCCSDRKATLLDFGCGTGDFAAAASAAGYRALGYEPDTRAAARAKEKGVHVVTDAAGFEAVAQQHSVSVITLWHVLEHIHDFPGILDRFFSILPSQGVLVVAVPLANSADAQRYRHHWAAWDVPRHLWHFTPDSLVHAHTASGFTLAERIPLPYDSFYIALLSEQNKNTHPLIAYPRALFNGLYSNTNAFFTKTPWSSEVFVFIKP